MTNPAALRIVRALPVAAASALALAGSALAQGTPEQREACAPDAIKLCQDTIPDVGRTTACMKAHVAELSPRCRVAFDAATGAPDQGAREERRVARAPAEPALAEQPDATPVLPLPDVSTLTPDDDEAPAVRAPRRRTTARREDPQTREARRVIASLCRNATLDASTCRVAGFALDMAR